MIQAEIQTLYSPIVRDATVYESTAIYDLIKPHVNAGILLPRSEKEILIDIRKFIVVDENGAIAGCGALEIYTETLCEIRSLVVSSKYEMKGYGNLLVHSLVDKASSLGLVRVIALTYKPDFFHKLGFKTVPKTRFPEKIQKDCYKCCKFNSCDEIAVLKELT